jgi:hypothetical protein
MLKGFLPALARANQKAPPLPPVGLRSVQKSFPEIFGQVIGDWSAAVHPGLVSDPDGKDRHSQKKDQRA